MWSITKEVCQKRDKENWKRRKTRSRNKRWTKRSWREMGKKEKRREKKKWRNGGKKERINK